MLALNLPCLCGFALSTQPILWVQSAEHCVRYPTYGTLLCESKEMHRNEQDAASSPVASARRSRQSYQEGERTMSAGTFTNTILQHLDADVIARLQLRALPLPLMHELEGPGKSIRHVFFLEEGIASMTTAFQDGSQVETSMFGYEAAVGVSALMGTRHSLNRIFMQLAGRGFASPVELARREFERNGQFHGLALRYVQFQLTLSTQNSACNARHTYEQKLARWLLICCDRARTQNLEMAQDFVAQMLGSTRSTVSIAAAHLKAKGLIGYQRGSISVFDVEGLEAEACECYRVVRKHLESLAEFDPGFVV